MVDQEAELLIALLADPDAGDDAKEQAARVLGRQGDLAAVAPLLEVARGGDSLVVRAAALTALERLAAAEAAPGLIDLWRRDDTDPIEGTLQMGVFDTLSHIGSAVVPALVAVLDDTSWNVRYYAAKTLGAIGDPSVADAIAPLVKDPHGLVSAIAESALEALRSK